MKRKIIIIGIVVALAASAALVVNYIGSDDEDGVIRLSGNVEVTKVDTGFKLSGRVVELLTDEGQRVVKGQKIAIMDSAELQGMVAQNRAAVSEAAVRLAELKAGSRPQEIRYAAANLKAAEADYEKASKDFARAGRLFKKEAMSAQQYDAAKSAYEARAGQVRAAREQLSLTREGPRREVIKAAEERLQQAKASLRVIEERFSDTDLVSSVSGVVLKKNVERGEVVQAGTPVFTIGEVDAPWIKVYVKEDRMTLVKLGQRASVSVDSPKGKKFYEGVVSYISDQAEFTPKTIQTQEERVKLVFGVKVRVKNENQDLKPGMPADVKIYINE
jgi:HlyD family secretion protein